MAESISAVLYMVLQKVLYTMLTGMFTYSVVIGGTWCTEGIMYSIAVGDTKGLTHNVQGVTYSVVTRGTWCTEGVTYSIIVGGTCVTEGFYLLCYGSGALCTEGYLLCDAKSVQVFRRGCADEERVPAAVNQQ